MKKTVFLTAAVAGLMCGTVFGEEAEAKKAEIRVTDLENATDKELIEELAIVGDTINDKVKEAIELGKRLESHVSDPRYTSKDVEKRREAVKKAEAALVEAKQKLREAVLEIPEVKAVADKEAALRKEVETARDKKKFIIDIMNSRKEKPKAAAE